ncbi:uncharacterized protein LOC109858744 isoform X2 [Pseudomyrmex gracilis]|uniref:uncharacterized protein LOC109858744 isoform X2 n=1 Tax=Pseudomyrmex gracilis TaxID=219809 RepID=UPI0009949C35|nr:uncharacterized protein LOC109858744 isoform X2 [Pseudomyrmex gracilis]
MSNMFACAICKQQKFQSFGHLVFHHKTKHSGTSCKICDAVCENKATLLWHYTTYHKKNNTYMSDNIYKEKEKLDEHRSVFLERSNTYDEEKMEVDDHQVGYSVHQNTYEEDKEKLDEHQSVQSAWPYTCAICDEEYNFFVSHVLPVHSSVALQHDCSICTSAYVKFRNRKSNLSSICDKKKEEDV